MWVKAAIAFAYTLAPLSFDSAAVMLGDGARGGSSVRSESSGGDDKETSPQNEGGKPTSDAPASADPTASGPVRESALAESPEGKANEDAKPAAAVECAAPAPHPMITEVLFAVPGGDAGDANGDGKRHVSGDEFVELYNPHDVAIQLRGYTLTDSNPADKGQLRFVFPMLELPPRGVVVVFNGFQCSWFGPVGDAKGAASSGNERFGGAWVFTMKAESQYVAFSNSGDHVLLTAPDGTAVHRVSWGEVKDQSAFDRVEPIVDDRAMSAGKSSVQRDSLSRIASFRAHTDLPFAFGGDKAFSPGVWSPLPEPKAKKKVEETEKEGSGKSEMGK